MADINEACKKLRSGDLIMLQYDEGNSGRPPIEVVAKYYGHNPQGKILKVMSTLIPPSSQLDTRLHRNHLADFNEIKGLTRLVPEELF